MGGGCFKAQLISAAVVMVVLWSHFFRVLLWSLGMQISDLRGREVSGLVEIFYSAIRKFPTSTPMCLIGNASTHWGGKHKEFCFLQNWCGIIEIIEK